MAGCDDVLIQDNGPGFRHRAHGKLGLSGKPELSHDQHVERDVERTRNLISGDHAAPGKGEYDHIVPAFVLKEPGRKQAPCIDSIPEHSSLFLPVSRAITLCTGGSASRSLLLVKFNSL